MVIPTAIVPPERTPTLTDDDIARLRAKVGAAASRRKWAKPPQWRTYRGGPLDGLRAALDDYEVTCAFYGWCAEATRVDSSIRRIGIWSDP